MRVDKIKKKRAKKTEEKTKRERERVDFNPEDGEKTTKRNRSRNKIH